MLPNGIALLMVVAALVALSFTWQSNLPADVVARYQRTAVACGVFAVAALFAGWLWRRLEQAVL